MSLESLINREQAAVILGVDPRTVQRYYVTKGLLDEHRQGHSFFYRIRDVKHLRKKIDAREALSEDIKEIYAMRACGAGWKRLQTDFSTGSVSEVKHALEIYTKEREGRLKAIGIEKGFEDYLMVEEVAARLRMADKHAVHKLIKDGLLDAEARIVGKNKKSVIKKKSLSKYLGQYSRERLYRSHHVADFNHGMTVYVVDRVARRNNIGFKVKEGAQDAYLFSEADIRQLRESYKSQLARRFRT